MEMGRVIAVVSTRLLYEVDLVSVYQDPKGPSNHSHVLDLSGS